MMDLEVGAYYKVAEDTGWKSSGAIIIITSKNNNFAFFTVVEESEHSRAHDRGNGAIGSLNMLPLDPKELTLYTFEPEEIPEVELQPTSFNDLFRR